MLVYVAELLCLQSSLVLGSTLDSLEIMPANWYYHYSDIYSFGRKME